MNNKEYYDEYYKELKRSYEERETDLKFRLGDQWDEGDEAFLKAGKNKRPAVTHNIIQKRCDLVTGSFRDNPADIRFNAMNAEDQVYVDIYQPLVKWILGHNNNKYTLPYAFSDGVDTGLGWCKVDMDYSKDYLNGEFLIRNLNPFSILFDPDLTKPDLSDCDSILQYSFLSKNMLKSMYPDKEKEIDAVEEEKAISDYIQTPRNDTKRVNVIERWYRETVRKYLLIDVDSQEVTEFKNEEERIAALQYNEMMKLTGMGGFNYKPLEVPKQVIKYRTETYDGLLLAEGENPEGVDMYPFIPFWGWFKPGYNDWEWKCYGIPRPLRGAQKELNKFHSQMLYTVMTLPFGMIIMDKGAVDNPNELLTVSEGIRIIQKNEGKNVTPFNPQVFNNALVEMDSMVRGYANEISVTPDLLGVQMSKSEPGINIQLRQKQGIAILKDFYDHGNLALEMIGKYIVKSVNNKWDRTKIERIVGNPLPEDWETRKDDIFLDVTVDLVQDSPSYRFSVESTLKDMIAQGAPVAEELVDYSDIPADLKAKIKQKLIPPAVTPPADTTQQG